MINVSNPRKTLDTIDAWKGSSFNFQQGEWGIKSHNLSQILTANEKCRDAWLTSVFALLSFFL
jgi:hypothetical protein